MKFCARAVRTPFSGLWLDPLLSMAWRRVCAWAERRRQRRALAELDERLLRDIGLTPGDAVREYAKPFWRV